MHAVRIHSFGDADVLKVEDIPAPEPADNEIVVRVMAASVNPVDYKIRSGKYPAVKQEQLPKVLGRDMSGVVQRTGAKVRKFKKGDAVYAMLGQSVGGYAQYTLVTEDEAAKKPLQLDFVQAAAVPLAALTAWQGLFDHGRLAAGQRVLIHGAAGAVGGLAVQFARRRGACVVGTAAAAELGPVRELGAHEAVDAATDFEDAVAPVDLVFDTVGGERLRRSGAVLRPGGRLVSVAEEPPDGGEYFIVEPNRDQLRSIARLADAGELRRPSVEIFPLASAREAFARSLERGRRGKVVLAVT